MSHEVPVPLKHLPIYQHHTNKRLNICNNSFITGIHLDSLGNYTTTLQLPQLIKTDQQSNSTSISICASSILRYILEGEYDNTHSYILLISSSQVEA
jgi:hypothetical protein